MLIIFAEKNSVEYMHVLYCRILCTPIIFGITARVSNKVLIFERYYIPCTLSKAHEQHCLLYDNDFFFIQNLYSYKKKDIKSYFKNASRKLFKNLFN